MEQEVEMFSAGRVALDSEKRAPYSDRTRSQTAFSSHLRKSRAHAATGDLGWPYGDNNYRSIERVHLEVLNHGSEVVRRATAAEDQDAVLWRVNESETKKKQAR